MHMQDALISPVIAGTMYVCSGAAISRCIHKINLENDYKKVPLMGIMGAFVFSAQMINFTIPGTGASGHFCGAILLTAILGPYAGLLSMASILLIQCLLFADGGLLALGCNIWNMGVYGCIMGALLFRPSYLSLNFTKKKILILSIVSSILCLQLGAFSVVCETTLSGKSLLPFTIFASFMQPVHLVIGIVEGVITGVVLCFLKDARPELLWITSHNTNETRNQKGLSRKVVTGILVSISLLTAGVFSVFASANPDGLEWSVAHSLRDNNLVSSNGIHKAADSIQNATALLKDYSLNNGKEIKGTNLSGLIGVLVVLAFIIICTKVIKRIKGKKRVLNNYE